MPGFNINNFKAEMERTGFAKASNFEVVINGPGKTKIKTDGAGITSIVENATTSIRDSILGKLGGSYALSNSFSFRIDSVGIPGRNVTTTNFQTYGPVQKMGIGVTYVDVNMSVICSPDLREREFFQRWQDLIGGNHRIGAQDSDERKKQFNVGYYNDYVTNGVEIYQLDDSGFRTYGVKLIDAYPVIVGGLNGNWGTVDIHRMDVTFACRYYEEMNQSQLGTQFRIGSDGVQIAGKGNIPFNPTVWKQRLNPRNIARNVAGNASSILKQNGVSITGF